jgi:two-component system invasion response regulator UvrY
VIRVLLADNHALFRAGIRRLLEDSGLVEVVAEAGSAAEALARVRAVPVDVAVLDIQMPGPGIQALLRGVAEACPGVRCLVLSVFEEEQYAILTRRAGALGYLTKERSPEDLLEAVRRAARGETFLSPVVERRLLAGRTRQPRAEGELPHTGLSSREQEVLRMLGVGKSVKEIAHYMACSPKTVSTFRARILKKLGFSGNADIVRYAQEHHLEA